MQGPLSEVVLLLLLVVLFGLEQRRRPELYFRFWLYGWVLVLVSVALWEYRVESAATEVWRECLREDTLAAGGIAFVFSFLVTERRWRVPVLSALTIVFPVCVGLDMIVAHRATALLLVWMVMVGQGASVAIASRFLGHRNRGFLLVVAALSAIFGAGMVMVAVRKNFDDELNLVLAQLFLMAGLLGARRGSKGSGWMGASGFIAWSFCYLLSCELFLGTRASHLADALWPVPKYIVGFGMILKIFEESNAEIRRLGVRHRRLYEEYRLLFQSNPHPMWIEDAKTSRFLAVNDSAIDAYGHTEEQFLQMTVADVVAKTMVSDQKEMDLVHAGMELQFAVGDKVARHRRADGRLFDVDITGHEISFEGRDARFVLAVDVTERQNMNRELVRQAHHDVLTGLPNRMMLADRMVQWLIRCDREEKQGALLTIDIDHFKCVNDTYGHLAGDECLKQAADRLRSRVRQVDTIARTGGEEFTIVIGGLGSREGAEKVCAELLRLFHAPILVAGQEIRITISIGVALYPVDGGDMDTLRRRSDQALYEAKREGRNRVVFASE
jgi:diguanylate cyclase (GGDEF)-like protein/PAS domain S-box-containing protein